VKVACVVIFDFSVVTHVVRKISGNAGNDLGSRRGENEGITVDCPSESVKSTRNNVILGTQSRKVDYIGTIAAPPLPFSSAVLKLFILISPAIIFTSSRDTLTCNHPHSE
jgi:hypothetical protein